MQVWELAVLLHYLSQGLRVSNGICSQNNVVSCNTLILYLTSRLSSTSSYRTNYQLENESVSGVIVIHNIPANMTVFWIT